MSPGAFLHLLLNPILNASQDVSHVAFHIAVMKPHNLQPQILQISLASLITFVLVPVTVPINLNDQFQPWAIEIDNVFVNRSLS